MEWVETTGRSVDEAKERALDQLGVAEDDAEFEVLEEPRPGLFGRVRGVARVRARVRPMRPRPKVERRDRRTRKPTAARAGGTGAPATDQEDGPAPSPVDDDGNASTQTVGRRAPGSTGGGESSRRRSQRGRDRASGDGAAERPEQKENQVDAQEVGAEAQRFVEQLVGAFGLEGKTSVRTDGQDIEVHVDGNDLGLLVGPRGSTLLAIQDLARVAAQRRLGDHDTRLRVDVAGYRERRREALSRFAAQVAAEVAQTGVARALEPMPSADRKVIHDVLTDDGRVVTRSEGDDPFRRVVIAPADA